MQAAADKQTTHGNLGASLLKRSGGSEEDSDRGINPDLENQSTQVAELAGAGSDIKVMVDGSASNVNESIVVHLSHWDLGLNTKDLYIVSFIQSFQHATMATAT